MEMIEETDEAYDAANTYHDLPKEAVKDLDLWEKMHFGQDDESDNEWCHLKQMNSPLTEELNGWRIPLYFNKLLE